MTRRTLEKINGYVIRRSCLTGQAVWLSRKGLTHGSMLKSYYRVCKREVERVREWANMMERRRANIERLLNACLAELPIDKVPTPRQAAAARELQVIAKACPPCHRDFYDHIMEERRRRKEDAEIRRQMRNRNKR